jgi:ADP-ribose pyrophosphatase YjhB (NUDIX family)
MPPTRRRTVPGPGRYRDLVTERTDLTGGTRTVPGWLSRDELEDARERLPLVYVDAVPVRVAANGAVTSVGLLLRAMPDGSISRACVSGRVLYGERIRDALVRHLDKDLGPMAMPEVPVSPVPFTVVEYFPDPHVSGFHDPRQHAVSLAFLVAVKGECAPSETALDLVWMTPQEAASPEVAREMTSGQGKLVRMALAHLGQLP